MKRVEEERDAVVSALTAQHEAAEAAAKQVGRVATQHTGGRLGSPVARRRHRGLRERVLARPA